MSTTKIYFEVTDTDEKIAELLAAGIIVDQFPEDRPWLWREASLNDPDGNMIVIYNAGSNRINPPWRIN